METDLIGLGPDPRELLITMLCRSVTSPNSKTAYENALRKFFDWLEDRPFCRETVLCWKESMESTGLAPGTVAVRLSAVRQLVREARIAGVIHDPAMADAIISVRGPATASRRTGNWLSAAQAATLILTPPAGTLRGRRDRALIATLIGCGLRRAELVHLRDADIGQREGRWCIVDLAGKGRKTRTIPVPAFAKALIDLWTEARNAAWERAAQGLVLPDRMPQQLFVSLDNRGGLGSRMSSNAVYETVLYWAEKAGLFRIAPHDLRRTFSRLALAGHADLHQIQLTLGHSSIQTTERYLGSQQDLSNAPCDMLGITLPPATFLERLGAEDAIKEDAERLLAERQSEYQAKHSS